MKRIVIFSVVIATSLLMVNCSETVEIDEEIASAQGFGNVYIPQANYRPLKAAITLTDKEFLLEYNAFYGGIKKASDRIQLKFVVDEKLVDKYNDQYGTDYVLLPEGSYEIGAQTAVIEPGHNATPIFNVFIKPKGYLEPFKPYLLPITVESEQVPVNETLNTVYYEIIASFGPGEVPREKVMSLAKGQSNLLVPFADDKLIIRTGDGTLQLCEADDRGIFGSPVQIGSGWQIYDCIFYFGPNRLVGVATDVTQYQVNSEGGFGGHRVIGWGWNIFEKVFPYKHFLIGVRSDGLSTAYPYDEQGDLDGGNIYDIASDWNRYQHLFAYGSSIIGMEADGNLWRIPISEETHMPQQRVQLGSGWDMYQAIVASGTDLLALDDAGDVWRYKFNVNGFWPLNAD